MIVVVDLVERRSWDWVQAEARERPPADGPRKGGRRRTRPLGGLFGASGRRAA